MAPWGLFVGLAAHLAESRRSLGRFGSLRARLLGDLDAGGCAGQASHDSARPDAVGLAPVPSHASHAQGSRGNSQAMGGYRSAASYLWLYKVEAQRRGYTWTDGLQRCLKDGIRSCERGMGPPTVAQPLPLRSLYLLPGGAEPWVRGGPANPRNAILVGAWWLMREMELATVRAAHVAFSGAWDSTGCGVRLTLPASKNDQAAFGTSRAHRCRCREEVAVDCPVHAVLNQWFWLRTTFPERFTMGKPALDLPLFPTLGGMVVAKPAFVSTIIHAGRLLGIEDSADGTERITGHTLRPTGAQGLIEMGWRADAVGLMGRWQSDTVTRYTRGAALHAPSDLAALIVQLCGVSPADVPQPAPVAPEPANPSPEEWVMNLDSDVYHLVHTDDRARCGWDYSRSGMRGSPPPPFHWHVCSTCAPGLRKSLKAQARAAGEFTRNRGGD